MEEFRDERLSRIMSWMQAWARGYLTRKTFKKLQEQRLALTVVQRSLRRYLKLRTWPWWKLWQKVKPLLNASRVEDQIAVSKNLKFSFDRSTDFWFNNWVLSVIPFHLSHFSNELWANISLFHKYLWCYAVITSSIFKSLMLHTWNMFASHEKNTSALTRI